MARDFDRKALKDDAFRDSMFWAIDWVYHRRAWFIGGGTALVLAVAGGLGWYQYRQSALRQETAQLYQAERTAQRAGDQDAAALGKARGAYEAFTREHAGSKLAPVAWMHVARIAWKQDDAAGTRAAFEAVLQHSEAGTMLRGLARIGLAKLEESAGNLDASAEHYKALTDTNYDELKALGLGRIAMARNQPEEARQHFEKAARSEPSSMLAEWARQNLDYHP